MNRTSRSVVDFAARKRPKDRKEHLWKDFGVRQRKEEEGDNAQYRQLLEHGRHELRRNLEACHDPQQQLGEQNIALRYEQDANDDERKREDRHSSGHWFYPKLRF
ncbi:hypothetical protein QOT17_25569 [Balamuthia mandrillaris]